MIIYCVRPQLRVYQYEYYYDYIPFKDYRPFPLTPGTYRLRCLEYACATETGQQLLRPDQSAGTVGTYCTRTVQEGLLVGYLGST